MHAYGALAVPCCCKYFPNTLGMYGAVCVCNSVYPFRIRFTHTLAHTCSVILPSLSDSCLRLSTRKTCLLSAEQRSHVQAGNVSLE